MTRAVGPAWSSSGRSIPCRRPSHAAARLRSARPRGPRHAIAVRRALRAAGPWSRQGATGGTGGPSQPSRGMRGPAQGSTSAAPGNRAAGGPPRRGCEGSGGYGPRQRAPGTACCGCCAQSSRTAEHRRRGHGRIQRAGRTGVGPAGGSAPGSAVRRCGGRCSAARALHTRRKHLAAGAPWPTAASPRGKSSR